MARACLRIVLRDTADQIFGISRKTRQNKGFYGGRTRDRTLDLSRVNHNP
jgi:hypothetical protein